MERRPLPGTDLHVSSVGLGTAPLGGLFGPLSEPEATRLIDGALDLGIDFIDTSRYYGSAEEHLGKALSPSKRDRVVLSTKAGRFGDDDFDFSAAGVRRSVEESLRLLRTDHVDILLLHDVEFVDLSVPFGEGYEELCRIRDEGLCRFIGYSGYPLLTMRRAMLEQEIDVLLTYAKGTLLDDSIRTELAPIADQHDVGLINAAAMALGLLAPGPPRIVKGHPATTAIRASADRMRSHCKRRDVDLTFLANQYAIRASGCATTLVGTRSLAHLEAAIEAAEAPLDPTLIEELIALRPLEPERQWRSGLPENN